MEQSRNLDNMRLNFQWFTGLLISVSLMISVYECFSFMSIGLLIGQWVSTVLMLVTFFFVYKGYPVRWALFMDLLLTGFFTFLLAGSKFKQASMMDYLVIFAALGFLGSALFLSFSADISGYLSHLQAERKKRKQGSA